MGFLGQCGGFKSSKASMLPLANRSLIHPVSAKTATLQDQTGTIFCLNAKGANTTHKIFHLGSDLADRDSWLD